MQVRLLYRTKPITILELDITDGGNIECKYMFETNIYYAKSIDFNRLLQVIRAQVNNVMFPAKQAGT